jgi:hypothetical protein
MNIKDAIIQSSWEQKIIDFPWTQELEDELNRCASVRVDLEDSIFYSGYHGGVCFWRIILQNGTSRSPVPQDPVILSQGNDAPEDKVET